MKTRRPPRLESVESREPPAAFGFAWPDSLHLTLGFVAAGPGPRQQQSDGRSADPPAVQPRTVHANLTRGGAR